MTLMLKHLEKVSRLWYAFCVHKPTQLNKPSRKMVHKRKEAQRA